MTGGIALGCDNNSGGIRKIYITDLCQIDSITEDSPDGEIQTITMESGALFYEFEFNKNTSSFTDDATVNLENGSLFYNQVVTLKIPRREKSKRDELALLMQKDLAVICLDGNGLYWFLGEVNGMRVTALPSTSGVTMADGSSYTITLTGQEPEAAREVDSTIIAALLV